MANAIGEKNYIMHFKYELLNEKIEHWKDAVQTPSNAKPILSFLPTFILYPLNFILYVINLVFCGSLVFLGGVIKFCLPITSVQAFVSGLTQIFYRLWAVNNFAIMRLSNHIDWQLKGAEDLSSEEWYLIIANHQSWLDILVLTQVALFRMPPPKFFLKEELRWAPFIGMACWALDMPFMKRYSQKFLLKNPHLRGQDIATTKRSCEKFVNTPTTIINFVEGTRFNTEKGKASKYNHLLAPKSAGIAFTLAAMGNLFSKVLNVTLVYPDNRGHVMKDMLRGELKRVVIDIQQKPVDSELVGDYFNDKAFKQSFQQWLSRTWQEKDQLIDRHLK